MRKSAIFRPRRVSSPLLSNADSAYSCSVRSTSSALGVVHEIKVKQIVDAHSLDHQNCVSQIRALDVQNRVWQHFVAVCDFGVQTITFTRTCATCMAGRLACLCLGDGGDHERIHSEAWIVSILLHEPRAHHVINAINSGVGLAGRPWGAGSAPLGGRHADGARGTPRLRGVGVTDEVGGWANERTGEREWVAGQTGG